MNRYKIVLLVLTFWSVTMVLYTSYLGVKLINESELNALYRISANKASCLINIEKLGGNAEEIIYSEFFWPTDSSSETVESYAIDSTFKMTNKSRFTGQRQMVLHQTAKTVLGGQRISQIIKDYRNERVLSSSVPIEIRGKKYAIFSELDFEEHKRMFLPLLFSGIITVLIMFLVLYVAFKLYQNAKDKDFEKGLKEAKLRRILFAAFRSHPDGQLIADEKMIIQVCNPRFERLLGYKSGELEGKSLNIFLPKNRQEYHTNSFIDFSLLDDKIAYRPIEPVKKDGTTVKIVLAIAKTNLVRGKPYFIAAIRSQIEPA